MRGNINHLANLRTSVVHDESGTGRDAQRTIANGLQEAAYCF
jgi:predicted GTPase